MSKIIFITGTDTGVGKTVMTALLLHHLRSSGVKALAIKPFCSGGREDAELLHGLQRDEITLEETNPFYFTAPLAPWAAVKYGKKGSRQVSLKSVLKKISTLQKKCDLLLIEGSGGLLVPLGEKYTVLNLIQALKCKVLVVGKNKLGTINHTLLSVGALQAVDAQLAAIVLVETKKSDFSSATNLDVLKKWSNCDGRFGIIRVPYIGKEASSLRGITRGEKKIKKVLAGLVRVF
jgi:dethiobiotin synthetase